MKNIKNFLIKKLIWIKSIFLLNFLIGIILTFSALVYYKINLLIFLTLISSLFSLPLLWLVIKLPEQNSRIKFLKMIHSINIDKKKLVGVEIGVNEGKYSEKIYNFFSNKYDLELTLIDPWEINDDFKGYGKQFLVSAYQKVISKFGNKKNITILREPSNSACSRFDDESLDFVYIDGNHDYKFVKEDLDIWYKKLRPNGVLFGDDYARSFGVHKAVSEFSFENKIVAKFSEDDYKNFAFIKPFEDKRQQQGKKITI